MSQIAQSIPVRSILEEDDHISEEIIKKLLVREDLNHLLLSDIDDLIDSLALDFSDVLKITTIGFTTQQRPIRMIEIDARGYFMNLEHKSDPYSIKPAILLTGAHHARELASIQMPLYSILRMLQGGILKGEDKYRKMLIQNKYYVVPVVNVDGLAYIEE